MVLVDNGGGNGNEALEFYEMPCTALPTSNALGLAEANNVAQQSGGPEASFVCFLNLDTRITVADTRVYTCEDK